MTTCDDDVVRVWSARTGRTEQCLVGHVETSNSADFSPDGTKIVTASYDKTARVWNAATGKCDERERGLDL